MRRALAAFFATAAGLALLLGLKTSPGTASRQVAAAPPPSTAPPVTTAPPPSTTLPSRLGIAPPATAPPPPSTAAPATTAPPARSGAQGASGTFTGPVVTTRYGPVQVEVTLVNGKLTDVKADELPVDRSRSAALSSYAAPILRAEALAAQGARIDTVSGASLTSRAYAQSLQAALDAAHG